MAHVATALVKPFLKGADSGAKTEETFKFQSPGEIERADIIDNSLEARPSAVSQAAAPARSAVSRAAASEQNFRLSARLLLRCVLACCFRADLSAVSQAAAAVS